MGREVGGRFGREGTCGCLWLIRFDIWQRTTKFCKTIILPLKKQINKGKKMVVPKQRKVCAQAGANSAEKSLINEEKVAGTHRKETHGLGR